MRACWGHSWRTQSYVLTMNSLGNVTLEKFVFMGVSAHLTLFSFIRLLLFISCFYLLQLLQSLTYLIPTQSWYTSIFKHRQTYIEILFTHQNLHILSSKILRSDFTKKFPVDFSVNCARRSRLNSMTTVSVL